jgi:predicted  nucleic acid-binding Zn-ribbon protein
MEEKRIALLERLKNDLSKAQDDVNKLQQALQQANAQVLVLQGGIQALELLSST